MMKKSIRYGNLLPISAVCALLLAMSACKGKGDAGYGPIQGRWAWNDSTLMEFQKISYRFSRDSFFLDLGVILPSTLKPHPCAQSDYHAYMAGRYNVIGDSIHFKGDYTDSAFSRATIKLCRDLGYKSVSHIKVKGNAMTLMGGLFARPVVFNRN